jgi:hypothetical protein
MNDVESRAREYLAEHSEYSEVFGQTFVAVDTLTAMIEFSKQETKEKSDRINKAKEIIKILKDNLSMYSGNYQKRNYGSRKIFK